MERIPVVNSDGSRTALYEYIGRHEQSTPVVLIYPAMGVKGKFYEPLAQALADAGYPSFTGDLRGKGESDIRPARGVDFGYREMIEQDLHHAVSTIRERHPARKLLILGHSLGGQLACLYASRYEGMVDGLVLVACCSVYYRGWKGLSRYGILMGTQFAGMLATAAGYFPGRRVGFGGTNARGTMQDWSRQSRTGEYRLNGSSFDYEAALSKLKVPVMTISFEGDNFAPYTAVQHLIGKFSPESQVEMIHLGKEDPLNLRYDHFNWPKRPGSIVRLMDDWLR